MKTKLLFLSLLAGLIVSSCVKEEYNLDSMSTVNWDPNGAAPLINSTLTLYDVLEDYDSNEVVVYDSSKLVYLVYQSRVYSETAEELISIGNQSQNISQNITIPGGALASGNTYSYNFSYNYDFNLGGGIELDSLLLKSGQLALGINTDFNYPALVTMTIANATRNGAPFSETFALTPGNPYAQNIDLSNTKLVFGNSPANRIQVNFAITFTGNGSPNNSPYSLNAALNFNGLQFRKIFGYLGQFNLGVNQDTVSIHIFQNNFGGTIIWEDPRLYIKVSNSMGIPVRTAFNYLAASRTKPPVNTVNISGSGIPNPWDIAYPSFAQIGQTAVTNLVLNKTNSNIDYALNINPQQVSALLSASSNPNGNVLKNFAFDTSRISVDAKLELPMHGRAYDFILEDTFDLSFGEDLSNIQWITFKIFTSNGFPVEGDFQIYFLDSNNVVKDSLLNPFQRMLYSALPGPPPDYMVTSNSDKYTTTTIEGARLDNLNNIKKAVIHAKLYTHNGGGQIVKIYSFYDLQVRLSAQAQFRFTSDDL